MHYNISVGRVAYSDRLRAGRSGDRIPVGGEIFRTCPDWPWGPPSLLYNGYRVFPGIKSGRGVTLTPHPLLVPWPRKSRAIPLLHIWAVRPVQSLSPCTRAHFTFTLQLYLYSPYGPYGLCRASVPVQGCTLTLPYSRAIPLLPLWVVRPVKASVPVQG